MKDELDYAAVPPTFVHCFNADCTRGENCLRRLAAQHAPATTPVVRAINPAAYPKNANKCVHYRSAQPMRFAWGLKSTFDDVPYKAVLYMKREIRLLYPKSTYYRISGQRRSISPTEQKAIADIFVRYGIQAPVVFDRYTEEYDWAEREQENPSKDS